jgi:hypothetical protein
MGSLSKMKNKRKTKILRPMMTTTVFRVTATIRLDRLLSLALAFDVSFLIGFHA